MSNAEGYRDPTAERAIASSTRVMRCDSDPEMEKVSDLIRAFKLNLGSAGFEVEGRITLVSRKTGRRYK